MIRFGCLGWCNGWEERLENPSKVSSSFYWGSLSYGLVSYQSKKLSKLLKCKDPV